MNIKQRADFFRKQLLNFLHSDGDIGFGKVGVVGHSVFFKVYTAKNEYWTQMYDASTFDHYPDTKWSTHLKNCEIVADTTIIPALVSIKRNSDVLPLCLRLE